MPETSASPQLAGITNLSLLAPIRQGCVESFDTLTHVARLHSVLGTLHGIRQASREAATSGSPFPDPVGRFDIVHFFRFAVVPPDARAPATGLPRHHLLLSVTFDGGWEPYLRVIWRDLGALLDMMLCHCEGYPLAHASPCETYLQWVRAHEIRQGFFYAESATTVLDQRRLKALAEPAMPAPTAPVTPAQRRRIGETALRAIRAFHGLRHAFPDNAQGDAGVLLRGMHDMLRGVRAIGLSQLLAPDDGLRILHAPAIDWFERTTPPTPAPASAVPTTPRLPLDEVQAGILSPPGPSTHGALVLLRVHHPQQALDTLARWPVSTEADRDLSRPEAGGLHRSVALTWPGLQALQLPAERLANLPREFIDGMDARAGLLGDLHGNHPDQWRPPLSWMPQIPQGSAPRIALSAVHVVVQLRGAFGSSSAEQPLHPTLRAEIERLQSDDTGLRVLAVEAMHRHVQPGQAVATDHFGFQDGFSQPIPWTTGPVVDSTAVRWSDRVRPGELLLGHPNDRDDARVPAMPDALLDHGSFLVVRKLAQHVGLLDDLLADQARRLQALHGQDTPDAAQLRTLLMGRHPDGTPLACHAAPAGQSNDFDYQVPGTPGPSEQVCPFQSHVRRANPRTTPSPSAPIPRLARRGMSYTDPSGERGLFFMAYNASIAEQFEVIQRWLSGGNSSGRLSWESDPFLGVPVPGGPPRRFQFTWHGRPMAIDLGGTPLVTLRWGLYLFAPSRTALRQMQQWATATASVPGPARVPDTPRPPPATDYTTWQHRMDDSTLRASAWATVRAQPGGVLRTDYGVLVGSKAAVDEVFVDAHQRYSVQGYGERMRSSIGLGYLGQDGDDGQAGTATAVNAVIRSVSEAHAHDTAYHCTTDQLRQLRAALPGQDVPVVLAELCETVLGTLCTHWFGLPDPDGRYMVAGPWDTTSRTTPTCPGHFVSVSRWIFSPHPNETVRQLGRQQGRLLREMVTEYLETEPATAFGPLTRQIVDALGAGQVTPANADLLGRTVAGVMLGFAPTVLGNLRTVLHHWVQARTLWDVQAALRDRDSPPPSSHARASAVLHPALTLALMDRPTPEVVWRTVRENHTLQGIELREGDRLIVGIASATRADLAAGVRDEGTVFGGRQARHGCPGHAMGMGVLLGVIAALLDAGTLRATASPGTLRLTA